MPAHNAQANVQAVKRLIVQAVHTLNPDSADVAQALAELTGEMAAKVDHDSRESFDVKMKDFIEVARIAYVEARIGIKVPILTGLK